MKYPTLIVAACVLAACGGSSSTGITAVACGSDSTLTYANFGSAFMANNCLSCHAARANPRLSTQTEVQSQTARILQAAVYTEAMPQGTAISLDERNLLGEWLACGAP